MRILRLHSFEGRPGGAERQIEWANEELRRRGHSVLTFSFSDPYAGWETAPKRGSFVSDLRSPEAWRRVNNAILGFTPDVIHLHHFQAYFGSIAKALGQTKVPIVFTAHDAEVVCPISTLVLPSGTKCEGGIELRCQLTGCEVGYGLALNLLERRTFDRLRIKTYIAPSRAIQEMLSLHGYEPTVHIPPIVPVHTIYPPREPTGVVGFLGRIEPPKGLPFLVSILRKIRETRPMTLDIAGDGSTPVPDEPWITKRGWLDGSALDTWWRGIDVLAVPSITWENYGLVAAEAVMRGVPCVVADVGGLPEVPGVQVASTPAEWAAYISSAGEGWGVDARNRLIRENSAEAHVTATLAVYGAL